jgi:predicted DCC family thiol-disulfide oxidoreductase YuxK
MMTTVSGPTAPPATTVVFYDGVCGLCNGFVRFLLHRDRQASLRFAPLQGRVAGEALARHGVNPGDLDAIRVLTRRGAEDEQLLQRSRAVLHAVAELGGAWTLAARAAALVPVAIADRVYAAVGRRRYRTFGRYDSCPIPPPEWRDRFVQPAGD